MPRKCIDPADVGGICPKGFVHTPIRALLPSGGEFSTDLCCPPEKGDPSVFCTPIDKKDTCPRGETKTVIVRLWPDGSSDKHFHCCPDTSFDYFQVDQEAQAVGEEDGEDFLEGDPFADGVPVQGVESEAGDRHVSDADALDTAFADAGGAGLAAEGGTDLEGADL
eukprot:tig00020824_g14234.t1